MTDLQPMQIDDIEYTVEQWLHAWNYGESPLYSRLVEIIPPAELPEICSIFDGALLTDLSKELFHNMTDTEYYWELESLSQWKKLKFTNLILREDCYLHFGFLFDYSCFMIGQELLLPRAYVIRNLIEFVRCVRSWVDPKVPKSLDQLQDHDLNARNFWISQFGRKFL